MTDEETDFEFKKLIVGNNMPPIGFGTWELTLSSVIKKAVNCAIDTGYRLIDTATIYDNEVAIGQAIRESSVPRQDLFITTKLWNSDQGYDSAIKSCLASMDRLGLDYIDLYLIHWPATKRRRDSWRAMIELQKSGRVKSIGVSNYVVGHLQELMSQSDVLPSVNQIEFHPYIYEQQKKILAFCYEHGILVEAYSPIARLIKDIHPAILKIAQKHHKSPHQIVLRWAIQHGTVPLPRSQSTAHIRTNFDVFNFKLDNNEMALLNNVSDGLRVTWDPERML